MNDSHIKNIIIIILLGIILGITGIYYFNNGKLDIIKEEVEVEEVVDSEEQTSIPKNSAAAPNTQTTKTVDEIRSSIKYVKEGVLLVTYSDSGFEPSILQVRAGESVRFVNISTKPMWVTTKYHPIFGEQNYSEFDQGKSISTGDAYQFMFTRVGVWGYKNLNNEKHLGTISVIEQ